MRQGCIGGHVAESRHNNRWLDLSLTVRFANLPAGAELELAKRASPPSKDTRCCTRRHRANSSAAPLPGPTSRVLRIGSASVKIALQLEGGSRVVASYPPSISLWDILVTAEAQSGG